MNIIYIYLNFPLFTGSSDPYVKFSYQNKMVYKTNTIFKNLNPVWDEEFAQLIDDPTTPINLAVNLDNDFPH